MIMDNPEDESNPLYRQHSDLNYWYKFLEDSKILYFKYNKCLPSEKSGDIEQVINEVCNYIGSGNVNKVVIDMRNNSGGSDGYLSPLIDKILNRYLYHYMNKLKPVIFDKASGCAQPNISTNEIGNIEIFVPEIKKQEKIVKVLDKAQELIDKRKEQIDQLDELVKSRFIEMFGEIKDYVTISEYIESLTAGKSLAGESECKNKVLNTGSVSYDYYDETQVKNLPSDYLPKEEHLVNKGDVLISRMNTAELVGATAYIWKSKDNIYIPDRLWKANFKPNVNPIFVWQLLIQRSTKEKIRRIASGTSGSMKNISKAGLLGIEVINVDIDKQNEFAEFVKQVDKLKFEMEKSLKELEDNFNSLMQKAFKGELF